MKAMKPMKAMKATKPPKAMKAAMKSKPAMRAMATAKKPTKAMKSTKAKSKPAAIRAMATAKKPMKAMKTMKPTKRPAAAQKPAPAKSRDDDKEGADDACGGPGGARDVAPRWAVQPFYVGDEEVDCAQLEGRCWVMSESVPLTATIGSLLQTNEEHGLRHRLLL